MSEDLHQVPLRRLTTDRREAVDAVLYRVVDLSEPPKAQRRPQAAVFNSSI